MNQGEKRQRKYLVGIDEAGRGPLAGPVAVGVVVISSRRSTRCFKHVRDAKMSSALQRERWLHEMKKARENDLLNFTASLVGPQIIDREGIVRAMQYAIRRSLYRLEVNPLSTQILLDGALRAPTRYLNQKTIIKGDEKETIIAMASVVAKTYRDKKMMRFAKKFPGYGFEKHKGYGTKAHYKAIKKCGLCEIHRRSFLKNLSN